MKKIIISCIAVFLVFTLSFSAIAATKYNSDVDKDGITSTADLAILKLILAGAINNEEIGSGGNNGNEDGGNITYPTDDEYFLNMPSELRGTTVKFATWIDHTSTNTADCIFDFETTTGMKYELVLVNQSDYVVKVTALIAAGVAPDVMVENGDFPKTLNLLQPLSKDTNGIDATDPFWDQQTSEYYHVGKNYYLVNGANSHWRIPSAVTYYHKALFEENGIKTPADYVAENNWNLDSLWTLMTQINSHCGLTSPGTCISFNSFLSTYGGNQAIFDTSTDTFVNTIKSDESRTAIDYMLKAKDASLVKIIDNHDDGITNAQHALQLCSAYGLRSAPGWFYTMDIDDLGFAVMPKKKADDVNYPTTSSSRAYGICKGAKNAMGAAYFLRYFLNDAHYDMNQVFKNTEAKNLYKQLHENQDISKNPVSIGINRILDPSANSINMVTSIINGTAAEADTNIQTSFYNIQSSVDEGNELIDSIISNQ